jgi:hypothetical protein
MSVRANERNEGELHALTEAQLLFNFIYHLTRDDLAKSKDNETKKDHHRWLGEAMRRIGLDIVLTIRTANHLKLDDEVEREKRYRLQNEADLAYDKLVGISKILYEQKILKTKKIKNLDMLIERATIVLRKWRKSDKERIKKLN